MEHQIPTETLIGLDLTLIGDDFDLDYVTKQLEIIPNYTRYKTEVLRNGNMFGHTEWGMCFESHPSWYLEDLFNEMYQVFKNKEKLLANVAKQCNAEWNAVYIVEIKNGDIPVLLFKKNMIDFFHEIGAEVGFDMYICPDNEEKDSNT